MWLWLLFLTALINLDLPSMLNTKPWWLWTILVLGAFGGIEIKARENTK